MASILLVDPSDVARKAMKGILARGDHKLATVGTTTAAIDFIHLNPGVDLVFTELVLPGEGGLDLVRRLKADSLLRYLPVVIYTEHGERHSVKHAVELRVQNFLIKPYHDDDIFAEIDKTEANPWRARHFEEEKSFCRMIGLTPAEVHRMLDEVRTALQVARAPLEKWIGLEDHRECAQIAFAVRGQAESAGAWGVVECLNQITTLTSAGSWNAARSNLRSLDLAGELIAGWLDPARISPGFVDDGAPAGCNLARERADWAAAPAARRCPVVPWAQLLRETEALPGCPVIDSAAAAFQMSANGHPSTINYLMDLVARDPGLSAQMLVAANQARPGRHESFTAIEDARLAVAQLGEVRLQEQARRLVVAETRVMDLPPAFSWPRFWTFQRGVARIAQLICRDLEFYSLEGTARTIGQLHDIGLLLLAHLHPGGFQAILDHARLNRLPLRAAEQLFLGGTTPQLAAHFADHAGLSPRFSNVLRWVDNPAGAAEDAQLVAIISLARDLCRHNEVGTSGDPPLEHAVPLEETAEWRILREGLYPSFNLRKFELQVHAYCGQLRTEFSGHQTGTVAEQVANAVN